MSSASDQLALRYAFGRFLSGVTVVTALTNDNVPVGFTASSFTSVSLDPPLLLVCPANSLTSIDVYKECTHFAVNILAEDQQDIANIFASFEGDRFARINWYADGHGCPVIKDVAASFSCSTHERIPAGDHHILLGKVYAFESSARSGLGYSGGGYFSLGLEREVAELPGRKKPVNVGAIVEHDGKLLMQKTAKGLCPPQVGTTGKDSAPASLRKYFSDAGLDLDYGPVYSIFESRRTGAYSTYYRCVAATSDTGGLGDYLPLDILAEQQYASPAIEVMVKRYVLERQSGVFGLYVGDEISGNVHVLDDESEV